MRRLIPVILLMLAPVSVCPGKITTDPNAPGARVEKPAQARAADRRLSQKVTYGGKLKPTAELADDLTQLTGVKFYAGRSNADWLVREDRANVFVKDLPLASLMDSIARAMHYKWVKAGEAPNWTYRLVEDPDLNRKAAGLEEARKKEAAGKRRWLVDLARRSRFTDEEIAGIRETYPQIYPFVKSGAVAAAGRMLQEVPQVRDAFLEGREFEVKVTDLPAAAQAAVWDAVAASTRVWQTVFVAASEQEIKDRVEHYRKNSNLMIRVRKPMRNVDLGSVSCGTSMLRLPDFPMTGIFHDAEMLWARAYDEKIPYTKLIEQFTQARAAELAVPDEVFARGYTRSDTDESYLDHADDALLHEKLREKVQEKTTTATLEKLVPATGLSVVSDTFRNRGALSLPKGAEFAKVSDWILNDHRNWRKSGDVVEIWNRNWYEERQDRLPQSWLEGLRKRFRENGTLDIDDLAAIASLRDGQFNRNISDDPELMYAASSALRYRDGLKLYTTFDADQRVMLFSEGGLSVASLTDAQTQAALKLQSNYRSSKVREFAMSKLGLRVTARRLQENGVYVYVLSASSSLGPLPGDYKVRTPKYVKMETRHDWEE